MDAFNNSTAVVAVGATVKLIIDVLRMRRPILPDWAVASLAIVLGITDMALHVYLPEVAHILDFGVAAAGTAMGIHSTGKKVKEKTS